MAISKKPKRRETVDDIISKGGSSSKIHGTEASKDVARVQLRIPQSKISEIDKILERYDPMPSRHHWLLEAIYEKIKREKEI